MILEWSRSSPYIIAGERRIGCSCDVRSIANGRRRRAEVVRSMPGDQPIDPVRFPVGSWTILRPRPRTDAYRAPYFIPTDAWVDLPVWSLRDGGYDAPTAATTRDREYGLHFSASSTTQGCIRILERDDLLWLVAEINRDLDFIEPCRLIVTE